MLSCGFAQSQTETRSNTEYAVGLRSPWTSRMLLSCFYTRGRHWACSAEGFPANARLSFPPAAAALLSALTTRLQRTADPLVVAGANSQVSFSFMLRINRPFTIYHGRRSRNLTPIFSSPSPGGEGFLVLAELFVSRRFPFGITIHHTREIPFMSILQNAAAAEEGELYVLFPLSHLLPSPSSR